MANHIGRGNHGDQGFGDDDGHHAGKPVTFDQFDTTTYLHSDNAADGSFVEHFILQVNGFELNGSPVTLPGFGSHYGMYFLIDAAGSATAFASLNVALMVDPGNNDGTPSATQQGIGFSNGTHGDFAVATGTMVSASLSQDAQGTRHANFVEQIMPTAAGEKIFGGSLAANDLLQELLTTPANVRSQFLLPGGASINLVNGGAGHAELMPQTALSIRPGLLNHDHFG